MSRQPLIIETDTPQGNAGLVRVDPDAVRILNKWAKKSGRSIRSLASLFIKYADTYAQIREHVTYDVVFEEDEA